MGITKRPTGHGIIPAYAGLTLDGSASDVIKGDHPRLRGVNLMREFGVSMVLGSSPLTRG